MKHILITAFSVLFIAASTWSTAAAHCEIPCGIYDDQMRTAMIFEHAGTIEKSMNQITELAGKSPANYNQLVRWITNKDEHADKIQEIVSQYFMTQRIKFDAPDYDKKLAALHQILVYAMKCKQTTDTGNVENLKKSLAAFEDLYFEKHHSHN